MRLVELSGNPKHGWKLVRYAYVPTDPKIMMDDSPLGRRKVGEAILGAVAQAGIKCKNVAVGLPARKTFTSIIEMEKMEEKDIDKTIRYELDKYVPMPINDAKADYVYLGESPNNNGKVEVLISSTDKKYAEGVMELYEKIGFNVIAMEPEPLALARSLMPIGSMDAHLIMDLGENSTDIVMVYQGQTRLVRTIPEGFGALARTVSTNLNVEESQARQFIMKFGLAQDKVDGQVFRVLDTILETFAQEILKSIRFFSTKYGAAQIGGIIMSGLAGVIPFIAEYMEAKTRISTIQGNPWAQVEVNEMQRQALASVAGEFSVAIGLAERSNE